MTDIRIQPIIMSGGAGTRLWPLSRKARPKQFLPLVTDKTMFQETALRLKDTDNVFLAPTAICGAAHATYIKQQLASLDMEPSAIITEPAPRNTAAVAAIAALWTARENPDALVLLTPADHHIADAEGFRTAALKGAQAAKDGSIVTFGIRASEPHTGFGYIEAGEKVMDSVYNITSFREKPDLDTAKSYLADGGYFWNSGIFLFSAAAMLNALKEHADDILQQAQAAFTAATIDDVLISLDKDEFSKCRSDSIDYAVMEKTDKAAVVAPVDVGWSDIGSWTALPTDVCDEEITAAIDCENTLIRSDGVFVGAIGLKDMIVVASKDAVLIAPRERAQEVKAVVERLKKSDRDDLL